MFRLALIIVGLILCSGIATAKTLVTDLSDRVIAVNVGFSGDTVLLFGAVDAVIGSENASKSDIIAVIKGPGADITLRRKERRFGVWANTDGYHFKNVPGYYAAFSSSPMTDVLPVEALENLGLGINNLIFRNGDNLDSNLLTEVSDGLRRNLMNQGLYREDVQNVEFLSNQLFRADVVIPANVPTGAYDIFVYVVRDQTIVGRERRRLQVNKVGVGNAIFQAAHNYSLLYGLIAVLCAIVAGYLSYFVFRRI